MKCILPLLMLPLLMLPLWAQSVQAHFIVDTQNREIHILKADEGDTKVILRFPLTLAYANELANRVPGAHFKAPFMRTELVGGQPFYRLDSDAILDDYGRFAAFVLRDFRFSVNGVAMMPEMAEYVLIDTHEVDNSGGNIGAGLLASSLLLSLCVSGYPDRPYISDTLVVVSFYLSEVWPADPLKIALLSAPFPVPEGRFFETRITDHRNGSADLLTFKGTGFDAVTLAGSSMMQFRHFLNQGVGHILTGYDHVLFVLCLVMAAASLRLLIWSVTGFTLGHSITLAAGIFGYVPQGAWFIPLIELLVATSILLMGALILLRKSGNQGFWLAGAIGLLHGFGFSFMLVNMLGNAGSALALALAGFNIGVELGQLAIVAVAFSLLLLATRFSILTGNTLRYCVAGIACVVALVMIFDRSETLIGTLKHAQTPLADEEA